MKVGRITERAWPPQCCVPAFVVAALEALGCPIPVPEALPHVLGVRVNANDANPYALPIARTPNQVGVGPVDAVPRIDEALSALGAPARFEHALLSRVPRDSLYEFAQDTLADGGILGIGVQYDQIDDEAPPTALHVLRIEALSDGQATLVDDSGEAASRRVSLPFEQVILAARAAGDGFWIFHAEAAPNSRH